MSRKQVIVAAALLAALAIIFTVAGCRREVAEVTSAWPKAELERVADAPPIPARWPFTGANAPDAAAVQKRPLSIKVENSSAARPQTGIGSADVVYETVSEGGITRFNVIFHSKLPKRVGPVRSARLSDLWVVPQYNALFFFSGASGSVTSRVASAKLPNLSQDVGVSKPYSRSSARSAPHNLYLDLSKAYEAAEARRYKVTAKTKALQYETRSTEATDPITEITIPFSQANTVRWVYKDGEYLRYNNGAAHNDEGLGKQITADNVVVMWAKYTPARRDKVGSTTYDITLGGKGRVSVFHNGQRFDGTWSAKRNSPPKFKDSKGRPIKLTVGRTWFQVIATDRSITMK